MKTRRILAAVLISVMLLGVLSSCGNKVVSKVNVKFVAYVSANGEELEDPITIGERTVDVEGTTDNPPTVLKAAQQALIELEFEEGFSTTADGYSIKSVKGYDEYQETTEDSGIYRYWCAYVNGERTTNGRQSEVVIYNNSELEMRYIMSSTPREDKQQ